MKAFRKIIFLSTVIIFFIPYYFVFANLQINEIMYDLKTGSDTGREWIEIYNDSDVLFDLSSYRLFEADTDHKIKFVQGDTSIGPKGYAVIVSDPIKFNTDWPNNAYTIFDSSFSLNNDGEILMLKDEKLNIVDQFTYKSSLGGAGDGNSLQKINGQWRGAIPTPGGENKISVKPPLAVPIVKNNLVPPKIHVEQDTNLIAKATNEPDISSPNKEASVVESDMIKNAETGHNSYIFIIVLILLLGTSAGAVYFIRKKKVGKDDSILGNDFSVSVLDE